MIENQETREETRFNDQNRLLELIVYIIIVLLSFAAGVGYLIGIALIFN